MTKYSFTLTVTDSAEGFDVSLSPVTPVINGDTSNTARAAIGLHRAAVEAFGLLRNYPCSKRHAKHKAAGHSGADEPKPTLH